MTDVPDTIPAGVGEARPLPRGVSGTRGSVQYHEFECVQCGETAKNTYSEPHRTDMLARRLCWTCNYWVDFEKENKPELMTVIGGHIYTPGNRTSGSFRGMAGRRFDIEYIEPSIYAGQRTTTFDLWSGSTLPEALKSKYPDTAVFLEGAERFPPEGEKQGCWNPSNSHTEPYPLPCKLVAKEPCL